jgi:hypothetical protein
MIKKIVVFLFLFITLCSSAQVMEGPEMADTLRENGKIYVVISVIGIIFICIVVFLIMLERKLKKLEDKLK